jgi:hypothetical protein
MYTHSPESYIKQWRRHPHLGTDSEFKAQEISIQSCWVYRRASLRCQTYTKIELHTSASARQTSVLAYAEAPEGPVWRAD